MWRQILKPMGPFVLYYTLTINRGNNWQLSRQRFRIIVLQFISTFDNERRFAIRMPSKMSSNIVSELLCQLATGFVVPLGSWLYVSCVTESKQRRLAGLCGVEQRCCDSCCCSSWLTDCTCVIHNISAMVMSCRYTMRCGKPFAS